MFGSFLFYFCAVDLWHIKYKILIVPKCYEFSTSSPHRLGSESMNVKKVSEL